MGLRCLTFANSELPIYRLSLQSVNIKNLGRFVQNNILENEQKLSSFLELPPCTALVKLNCELQIYRLSAWIFFIAYRKIERQQKNVSLFPPFPVANKQTNVAIKRGHYSHKTVFTSDHQTINVAQAKINVALKHVRSSTILFVLWAHFISMLVITFLLVQC